MILSAVANAQVNEFSELHEYILSELDKFIFWEFYKFIKVIRHHGIDIKRTKVVESVDDL